MARRLHDRPILRFIVNYRTILEMKCLYNVRSEYMGNGKLSKFDQLIEDTNYIWTKINLTETDSSLTIDSIIMQVLG